MNSCSEAKLGSLLTDSRHIKCENCHFKYKVFKWGEYDKADIITPK